MSDIYEINRAIEFLRTSSIDGDVVKDVVKILAKERDRRFDEIYISTLCESFDTSLHISSSNTSDNNIPAIPQNNNMWQYHICYDVSMDSETFGNNALDRTQSVHADAQALPARPFGPHAACTGELAQRARPSEPSEHPFELDNIICSTPILTPNGVMRGRNRSGNNNYHPYAHSVLACRACAYTNPTKMREEFIEKCLLAWEIATNQLETQAPSARPLGTLAGTPSDAPLGRIKSRVCKNCRKPSGVGRGRVKKTTCKWSQDEIVYLKTLCAPYRQNKTIPWKYAIYPAFKKKYGNNRTKAALIAKWRIVRNEQDFEDVISSEGTRFEEDLYAYLF